MLNMFRRREVGGGTPPEGPPGSSLVSHVLAKFLKRLRAMERPHLLDLGRLSGANIEFFAQAGCKVQVEDLLHASEPGRDDGAGSEAPSPDASAGSETVSAVEPLSEAAPIMRTTATGARVGVAVPGPATPAGQTGSGGRPTRRIILPPRTFRTAATREARGGRGGLEPGSAGSSTRRDVGVGAGRCGLPTTFPYPDESFDAVVAWDIFNYYDPASARQVAGETRRILKPGGLLLAYFHARRLETADSPGRYRILDDRRVACDPPSSRLFTRHLYQNRDIEKMFAGLRIFELYFLKTSMREMLLEKRTASTSTPKAAPPAPKLRFTIE